MEQSQQHQLAHLWESRTRPAAVPKRKKLQTAAHLHRLKLTEATSEFHLWCQHRTELRAEWRRVSRHVARLWLHGDWEWEWDGTRTGTDLASLTGRLQGMRQRCAREWRAEARPCPCTPLWSYEGVRARATDAEAGLGAEVAALGSANASCPKKASPPPPRGGSAMLSYTAQRLAEDTRQLCLPYGGVWEGLCCGDRPKLSGRLS